MRALDRHSIGFKIFAGFMATGLMIAVLGAFGYAVLSTAGGMVTGTYDGPLMAINFARAADVDFLQMRILALRRVRAPDAQKPVLQKQVDELLDTFHDDISVASQRSTADDERKTIGEIRALVGAWHKQQVLCITHGPNEALEALAGKISDRFDDLIEYNADHSFVDRRKAMWSIYRFETVSIAGIAIAVLATLLITQMLARQISRPLSAAARVADRIAAGELETPIPAGGRDETGTLLNSMHIMQDNIRNMVEREQARAQSAEARLMDALENAHEGIVLFGADGRIVTASSQFREFFPTRGRQLEDKSDFVSAMSCIESQLAKNGERTVPLSNLLRAQDESVSGTIERQLQDGRWLRFSASRTTEDGLMIVVSDFTNIKKREEEYRVAKIEAEAASAAKSRFLANMSHELRTPLNAIIGFSEVISGEMFGELGNDRYLEYSTDILRSGRHLLDVVNSVLDLAKSESGKMELTGEVVDLRFVLLDCAKMLRDQCTIGGLKLNVPQLAETIPVWGEKSKLRQIFLNLLSNAAKFTERGGTVSIHVTSDAQHVAVEIADTGIGMTEKEIAIALTPFGQVDNRLERRYEGTGLGLPLTKALIELHDGDLAITSEPGKGTKVTVRFGLVALGALAGADRISVAS